MITAPVLLDTGPLVALLHRDDSYHDICRAQAAEVSGPIYTSWAVVTEAAWLLRRASNGLEELLKSMIHRDFVCRDLDANAAAWLIREARNYASLSPQLADLTLVYLDGIDHVFTLDRRDFSVLRSSNGRPFTLLPPNV